MAQVSITCDEPDCARRAVESLSVCRFHLADSLRRDGEVIPFEDPELAGLLAAAVHIVRSALADLPEDLVGSARPDSELDMYAMLDPKSDWEVAQAALDLLGALLSDQPLIGRIVLSPPMEFHTRILLRLRVSVPSRVIDELQPRLYRALEGIVHEVVGRGAAAHLAVEPYDESEEWSPQISGTPEPDSHGDAAGGWLGLPPIGVNRAAIELVMEYLEACRRRDYMKMLSMHGMHDVALLAALQRCASIIVPAFRESVGDEKYLETLDVYPRPRPELASAPAAQLALQMLDAQGGLEAAGRWIDLDTPMLLTPELVQGINFCMAAVLVGLLNILAMVTDRDADEAFWHFITLLAADAA